MKNLLVFVLLFVSYKKVKCQTFNTQIGDWNAIVTLPSDYNSTTLIYPVLIFFPGLGEVGTDITRLRQNGPHAFITETVNPLPRFIVVSLQPSAYYPHPETMHTRINTLIGRYRIDTNRINLTGLSHGGWCSNILATYRRTANDSSFMKRYKITVNVQGVQPGDNYGATGAYPSRFADWARYGGKQLCFEQVNDFRDMNNMSIAMNGGMQGSCVYLQTTFGGGAHCCWSNFYGGGSTQPSRFIIEGTMQSMYEWIDSKNDLSVLAADTTIRRRQVVRKTDFYYDANSVYLKTTSFGYYSIKNMVGQTLMKGNYIPGQKKINIETIRPGVYVLVTDTKVYKFIKF